MFLHAASFLFTRERTIGMKLNMVQVRVRVDHLVSGGKKAYHSIFQPKILVWRPSKVRINVV